MRSEAENPPHAADRELLNRARRGERVACEHLIERMRCIPRVLAAKNSRSGSPLQADDLADLAQEVFALVWQRAESYRGEAALETWVTSFTLHLYMNALRRLRRGPRSETEGAPAVAPPARDGDDGAELRDALASLEPAQASVVRLRQYEDLSFDEIARLLGVPVGTAKSRYSRALAELRRALGPKKLRGAI